MRKIKEIESGGWVPYTIATCSAVVLFVIITHFHTIANVLSTLLNYIFPVAMGAIIAYVLEPLVRFFERTIFKKVKRKKIGRNLSVALAFILLLVFVIILMSALIPQLISSVLSFIDNMDGYISQLLSIINSFGLSVEENVEGLDIDMSAVTTTSATILGTISSFLRENIALIVSRSQSIGSGIFTWIIAIILSIYFLSDMNVIVQGIKKLLKLLIPKDRHTSFAQFIRKCNGIITKYVVYELIDALIVGISNFVFMTITRMPYAVLISVVVGVTNLAPTFGPIVGGVIGSFILLLADPWKALSFLIFTFVLQTIDGYVIKPKMFGGSLGVSSVVILAFIIIGGRMFGLWGVLLAIPCAAIIDSVYHEIILVRLERHQNALSETQMPMQSSSKA